MQNVYLFCRKIHRFTLFFTVALGLLQMMTGLMMKFSISLLFLDVYTARIVHNTMSIYFAIALGTQMMTGLYMYIHPWIVRWRNSRSH